MTVAEKQFYNDIYKIRKALERIADALGEPHGAPHMEKKADADVECPEKGG